MPLLTIKKPRRMSRTAIDNNVQLAGVACVCPVETWHFDSGTQGIIKTIHDEK